MVQNLNEIWVCPVCGNRIEVVTVGGGPLICCGQAMHLEVANTDDTAVTEKHVPVIEKVADGYLVKIGSTPHPMSADHHIEWIELMIGDRVVDRYQLQPNEAPEALFRVTIPEGEKVWAREYCNLHHLWSNQA